jgi:hypothetical protein
MYSKKLLIAFLCAVFLYGCGNKNTHRNSSKVVSINPYLAKDFINLSEIVDSVKLIKLQVPPDDIMGRVREIIIKKRFIYAADYSQQMVFVFDKEGKFVAKLAKRGPGPEDYLWMGPVFVDDNEEYIELVNMAGAKTAILKYSNLSFNLIESTPFPDLTYNSCKKKDGYYYFSPQQIVNTINGKKSNPGLVIADADNNKKVLFDKTLPNGHTAFSPNNESFVLNDKNELCISIMYDNTFYRLDSTNAIPIFSVDFGKYGINNAIGLNSVENQMEYIQKTSGVASFPVLNVNNKDIVAFSYYFKQSNEKRMYKEEDFRLYIEMKKNGKIYHTKQIKNDITDFPDHVYVSSCFFGCIHQVWYENYLVDVILPSFYFSDKETESVFVEGLGEITAEDDPIIVMMKLKNR